jgi:Protein of unknown function (DUF1176)
MKDSIPSICLWEGAAGAQERSLTLRLDGTTGKEGESLFIEPVRGASETSTGPATLAQGDGAERYTVRGSTLDTLIAAMHTADAALIRERQDGPVVARASLARLALALHAMLSYTKPYQPTPTLRPQPFERISIGDLHAAEPLLREHCGDAPQRALLADGFRLSPELQLWSISCRRAGLYNMISLAITVGVHGAIRPLVLSSIVDYEGVGPDFSNLAIHPAEGVIEDLNKSSGAGDCGKRRRWGWTGMRFELLTEDYMPRCFGAGSSQWLRVHRVNEPRAADKAKPPC